MARWNDGYLSAFFHTLSFGEPPSTARRQSGDKGRQDRDVGIGR